MIEVFSLSGKNFILNEVHIEKIESVPETVITLVNGKKYLVKESPQDIINKVVEFKLRYWSKVRVEESHEEE